MIAMKHDLSLHLSQNEEIGLIPVISKAGRVFDRRFPSRDVFQGIRKVAHNTPPDAPIIVMLHGQGFDPCIARVDPFRSIFAYDPYGDRIRDYWRLQSWAHRFKCAPQKSMMIGYGWQAHSTDFVMSANVNAVARNAVMEAQQFGAFVQRLNAITPQRPVHVIAHGMGAKLALRSLETTPKMRIKRLIMLNGQGLITDGLLAMNAKAGQKTEFYNIYERSTARLRFIDRHCEKAGPIDHILALGFPFQRHRWVDIPLADRIGMFNLFKEHPKFSRRPCAKSFTAHFHGDALINSIAYGAIGSSVEAIKTKLNDRLRPYKPMRRYPPCWLNPLNYFVRPV